MIKPKAELFTVDERQFVFVMPDDESGHHRSRTFDDHYDDVAAIELSPSVGQEVIANFDNA